MNTQYSEDDARFYTTRARNQLEDVVKTLRTSVNKVTDPKAEALFETAAEVLIGLQTAFDHYEQKSEEAWR